MALIYDMIFAFGFQFVATIWDFQKAIAQQSGKPVPSWMSHENNWHLITISIWAIPSLVGAFYFQRYGMLTSFLMPFNEDMLYYIFNRIFYGKWIPDRLHWLEEIEFKYPWIAEYDKDPVEEHEHTDPGTYLVFEWRHFYKKLPYTMTRELFVKVNIVCYALFSIYWLIQLN